MENSSSKPDADVISFAKEMLARRGVKLDEEAIANQTVVPTEVSVDPNKDPVVRLALSVLRVLMDEVDEHPIRVMAAMHVAGTSMGQVLIKRFGKRKYSELAITATSIGRQYVAKLRD